MVSIIIPVYNASAYLSNCIQSVVNQTYKNIEIIIINDGSTDDSLEICQNFSNKDSRIKIINNKNSGVSVSRNLGIKRSSGDWIIFLDSDDWLEIECITECIYNVKESETDLLCFNHYTNTETSEWEMKPVKDFEITNRFEGLKYLSLSMMFPGFFLVKKSIHIDSIRAVWGKFFRSSIIKQNKVFFNEKLKISEDAIFCLDYISHIKRATLFNKYLIHHRLHKKSVMNRYQKDIFTINLDILEAFYTRYKSEINNDEDFLVCYCGNAIECLFRALKMNVLHHDNKSSFANKMKEISSIIQGNYFQIALTNNSYKYLPRGKKELLYFSKKNSVLGIYIIGRISIFALLFQSFKNNFRRN